VRRVSLLLAFALAGTIGACSEADRNPLVRAEASTTSVPGPTTTGDGATSTSGADSFVPEPIEWFDCGSGECALVTVPRDYADPTGSTIDLAVFRDPADGDRIGPLFVNPGGPGASAIESAQILGDITPGEISEHFDIVGVDPRGVGDSEPIDCGGDFAELYGTDPSIETPADRDDLLTVSREYIEGCERDAAALLPFLGSREIARDIDAVRAAMGDEQLSYVGYSYGTVIGQVYADLFPSRVRAMVLDGIAELGPDGIEQANTQAAGFERALRAFTDDCDRTDCRIAPRSLSKVDELFRRAENVIDAPDANRDLGPGELAIGIALPLYSTSRWPQLAEAVDEALDGDGSAMVGLADTYLSIASLDVYFATSCIDADWPEDPDDLLAAGKAAAREAPRFGEIIVTDYVRCALWPAEEKPLESTTAPGTPPILVISTTNDPATPYESGVRVADTLESGVLLTYEGDGHTVFGNGVDCIDDTVATYLVDLDPPADGARC
jgi:pimeloyl-ACP methyl ester carboxylesterase